MEDGEVPAKYMQHPWALKHPGMAHILGRDPARTPMLWDNSPNAGFAFPGVRTWLPIANNYARCNVERQSQDPTCMLGLYRALHLHRTEPSLVFGDYEPVDARVEDVFACVRCAPNASPFLIGLNFSSGQRIVDLHRAAMRASIAVSTDMRSAGDVQLERLVLSPNQGLVLRSPRGY